MSLGSVEHMHLARRHLTMALQCAEGELEEAMNLFLAERAGCLRALLAGMDALVPPGEMDPLELIDVENGVCSDES